MRYTKEMLESLVKQSESVTEVLRKLDKRVDGGTHSHVSKRIKEFGISTDHFSKVPHNKGKISPKRLSALEYLKSSCIKSHKLKLKLIADGIRMPECDICHNNHWMGQPMPFELDHIDGDHTNNDLTNLRILCPNCHAMLPTNSGKNRALKNLAT